FYLCTFIDAYTREVLGWAMSRKMDVELVRSAYAKMKEAHGSELDKAGVLIPFRSREPVYIDDVPADPA
ncbi:MAG: hypothetical protein V8T10_08730, partial [Merdibacter sp.]